MVLLKAFQLENYTCHHTCHHTCSNIWSKYFNKKIDLKVTFHLAKNKRKFSTKEEFRPFLKDLKISNYALRTLIPPWTSINITLTFDIRHGFNIRHIDLRYTSWLRYTSPKPSIYVTASIYIILTSICVIFDIRSILTGTNLDVYRGPPVMTL